MLRQVIFSILSGIILALPFINGNLWIFAWLGFLPLFFALENKSRGKAFLLSYLCGITFWWLTIYWLVHITFIGTFVLVLYLALYFGLFGLIIKNYELLFIPAVWVILEYIRSRLFTGFPWALIGYSQYLNLPVIQIADIFGAPGVSFVVMLFNAGIYSLLRRKRNYLLPISCLVITLIYGYFKIYQSPLHPACPAGRRIATSAVKVSVIQGNIPQELKWDERAAGFIINRYVSLTEEAAGDKPDLIIWPEAASPGLFGEDEAAFQGFFSLAKKIKTPLLLGAVARNDKEEYFNSALLIDAQGRVSGRYDKLHLVPFGEYIPLKNIFRFLETVVPIGDIAPGKEYTLFSLPNTYRLSPATFSVLICFEDLFPELSREFVRKGAGFLVNITNDAWYKETTAPYQHLQASVFRAMENRVFLARAANTGISGFISPGGRIISLVKDAAGQDIFVTGYITQDITADKKNLTFYTRHGDVLIFACFLFIPYAIISRLKNKK